MTLSANRRATRTAAPRRPTLVQTSFITGKGGSGKTTLAAALALALAQRHHRVTLVDLDRRGALAEGLREALIHPNLRLLALSPHGELQAFIERIVPISMIARRMLNSRTFAFVTAALPGLEAFLILERIRLIADGLGPDERLVVDGPASGGALELLAVPTRLTRLAPVGTLHRLAAGLVDFLRDPTRFRVAVVLRPEELSLSEALCTRGALETAGIACAGMLVNGASDLHFSPAEIARVARYPALDQLARLHQQRHVATEATRRRLRRLGLPTVEAPRLDRSITGRAELEMLADCMAEILASR